MGGGYIILQMSSICKLRYGGCATADMPTVAGTGAEVDTPWGASRCAKMADGRDTPHKRWWMCPSAICWPVWEEGVSAARPLRRRGYGFHTEWGRSDWFGCTWRTKKGGIMLHLDGWKVGEGGRLRNGPKIKGRHAVSSSGTLQLVTLQDNIVSCVKMSRTIFLIINHSKLNKACQKYVQYSFYMRLHATIERCSFGLGNDANKHEVLFKTFILSTPKQPV